MNFNAIPDFETWTAWQTADGTWEVKLEDYYGNTLLHLVQDEDAASDQVEDGKFYLDVEYGPGNLKWIREREAFEMDYDVGSTVDADYVSLNQDGCMNETQHNHIHLDRDVEYGKAIALTPV